MRKGYVALLLGVLASACGGGEEAVQQPPQTPPPVATTPPPAATVAEAPMPAKPTLAELEAQTAKALVEAFNAHDAKKAVGYYTEDTTVTIPGLPVANGELHGRADLEKQTQAWFDAFKDLKFWFSRAWVKGDVAAYEWGWSGTHTGDLMGVKATEKPAGAMGLSIVWFDQDGHIKKENRYQDMLTILTQVGAAKGKARPVPTPVASPEIFVSKGTPEEDKLTEISKGMTAAVEAKKEADFLALLNDDSEYVDVTQPDTMKGKADAKKFFGMFTKAFPDAKHSQGVLFAAGDYVINEATMNATQKGPLGPLPASKKPVALHAVDVALVKDGKMVKGWGYSNSVELLSQIGAFKAPAAAKTAAPAAGKAEKTDKAPTPATAAPAAAGAKGATGGGAGTGGGTGGGGGSGTGGGGGGKKADAPKADPAKK